MYFKNQYWNMQKIIFYNVQHEDQNFVHTV